jgi:uncharacterized membrane protein
MSRWGYLALFLPVLAMAGSAGAYLAFHDQMPDQVPVHWGIDGQPDGWATKDKVFLIFFLLPTVALGVIALGLFVLPWLSPRNFAVASFRQTYDYVFALVAALFAYMHAIMLPAMIAGTALPERPFLAGIFIFFALIGNVLGKLKPNFWMGIRTPWTLADPQVWDRTHRVGAWSFAAFGVMGAIAVLLGAPPVACFFALVAAALWPVVYSLLLYKRLERLGQLSVQRTERETVGVER